MDALVVPVYKNKGSRSDPTNYRSIFLLDTVGKVYASMMCHRLQLHIKDLNAKTQFAFRVGRSTQHAILGIRTLIQKAIDQKQELALVFVDLRKAFDSIPHAAGTLCNQSLNCLISPFDYYVIQIQHSR